MTGRGGDDGVDEVDADEHAGAVALGQEGHERAADDTRDAAHEDPGPAVGGLADAEADEEGEDDADQAGGRVEEGGDGAGEAEGGD